MMRSYICPRCGMEFDAPGKCMMCDVPLRMHEAIIEVPKYHDHTKHHRMMIEDFRRRLIFSLVLTIPILILSPMVQEMMRLDLSFIGDAYLMFIISLFVFIYCGHPFFTGSAKELSGRQPGMMTLIALAISVAFGYSTAVVFGLKGQLFFLELVTLIDVMLLGHYLEMRSVLSASSALEKLVSLLPNIAHIQRNGEIADIPLEKLVPGNIVLVKAGERIPADGVIVQGKGSVDESMLTGESAPVARTAKDRVIGGSLNGDAPLRVRVAQTGERSYLSKVVALVSGAQAAKSRTQDLADKAAVILTVTSISVGIITFASWLLLGKDMAFAIERMASVMVITCPHALGLAIPLVAAVSTALSAKRGILVHNRTAFESSRNITAVLFDKTGTLTEGHFSVIDVIPIDGSFDESGILEYAAPLEVDSEHPVSKAILARAKEKKVKIQRASQFAVIKGQGVSGVVMRRSVKVVSRAYLKRNRIRIPKAFWRDIAATTVFVIVNDRLAGAITLEDRIRQESFVAIRKLKAMGIKCWMLTGDNKKLAKTVADRLGMDGSFAEVLPREKMYKVRQLQHLGEIVAMVGDGINDAPALAQANIGVAIGSGTDVAATTADVVLVRNDPQDVIGLISYGKATYRKMMQNLFWATAYNVIAIPLAAGVLYNKGIIISPALGAVFMSLSTIIVAINAKLLRF